MALDTGDKAFCWEKAVEIVKAYGQGGVATHPDVLLQVTYKKLVELKEDVQSGD